MIDLIIRADDVGYSEAVNYGIEKTVKQGLIGSVGLMPNMPAAAHGLALLEGTGVCIGQHTNICIGRPCADPASIPSLLDENGMLKSSRTYREAWKKGECFTVLEEMVLEIEAQYQRFVELTGRQPDYFEGHAVMSRHLMQGLEIVAQRHGLKYNNMGRDRDFRRQTGGGLPHAQHGPGLRPRPGTERGGASCPHRHAQRLCLPSRVSGRLSAAVVQPDGQPHQRGGDAL